MNVTDLVVWGILAHLIADWVFQNDYIAKNKGNLRHPAAWVHGIIHACFSAFVFGPLVGVAIGASHMLIDTRIPLRWWQHVIKQTSEGPYAIPVSIWLDQVFHFVVIVAFAIMAW